METVINTEDIDVNPCVTPDGTIYFVQIEQEAKGLMTYIALNLEMEKTLNLKTLVIQ